MSKKNILFLTQSFVRFKDDITSHFLFALAKQICKSDYEVRVVAPHQAGLKEYEEIDGLPIHRFRYGISSWEKLAYTGNMVEIVKRNPINRLIFVFFLLFFFLKAYRLTRRFDVKLIHAHWWIPSGLVGYLVSSLLNRPLLITTHGTDLRILSSSRTSLFLARLVFRKASYITVVSNFLKKKLISELSLPENKILVIPMPVNPDRIKLLPAEEHPSKKVILCVARYTRQKRLDILLEALSLLRDRNIDFEAILIGEGPEKDELLNRVKTLSLEGRVKFLDLMSQEELNRYYNLSQVVVLPSLNEGFGLVLVEAGLCKKPVVGTDSGGIPDIIEDRVNGLLVPPEDHLALARAIEEILSDENLASRLGQNAYEQVWKNFSPQAITKKFISVYEKLSSD